jgi:hypothetical protein
MKYLSLPVLLLSLLLFSSCSKDSGTTTASGQVIDDNTGLPVPNAVILNESNPNSFSGGGGPIASYACDKDGKFSFSFSASSNHGYYLDAAKSNNNGELYAHPTDKPFLNKGSKNKNLTLKLNPLVFVRLHAVEVNSIKGTYLSIGYFNPIYSVNFSHIDKYETLHGNYSANIKFAWVMQPDTNVIVHDTLLQISPLDTLPLTLYY